MARKKKCPRCRRTSFGPLSGEFRACVKAACASDPAASAKTKQVKLQKKAEATAQREKEAKKANAKKASVAKATSTTRLAWAAARQRAPSLSRICMHARMQASRDLTTRTELVEDLRQLAAVGEAWHDVGKVDLPSERGRSRDASMHACTTLAK